MKTYLSLLVITFISIVITECSTGVEVTPLPIDKVVAPTFTRTPSKTPLIVRVPTRTLSQSPTLISSITPLSESGTVPTLPMPMPGISIFNLSPEGPWLVLTSYSTFPLILNPDGSGQSVLIENQPQLWDVSISPSGSALAYVVDTIPDDDTKGLQLRLATLPDISNTLITELQNPNLLPPKDQDEYDSAFESMRAITSTSPSWSHNGKYIAFVGQQEGPSADLYVYDYARSIITRLSDGPSQAYAPSWSPDDNYIFHKGAWLFGTGAGPSVAGNWLVKRDGSKMIEISEGNVYTLGWQNTSRLLVANWDAWCEYGFLRSFNIDNGIYKDIWPYYFSSYEYIPATGQFYFVVSEDYANCTEDQPVGLFVLEKTGASPRKISDQDFWSISTDPSTPDFLLLRSHDSLFRLSSSDEIQTLVDAPLALDTASYSENANLWLISGEWNDAPGLWIGTLPDYKKVYDGSVVGEIWSPDGQAIFFIGEKDELLYRADAPDFQPYPIASWTDPSWQPIIWVEK